MSYRKQFLVVIALLLSVSAVWAQQQPKQEGSKERTIIFNLRQESDQQMTCFLSQEVAYTFEVTLPEESKAQRIVLKLYDGDMNEIASSTTVLKNNPKPSLRYSAKKSGLYLLKVFPFAK